MRTIGISIVITCSVFLFSRCGLVWGVAIGLDNLDSTRRYNQLERNNRKFDRDGWYSADHHFNPDSLYSYFIKKDSLDLAAFYLPEEFNFVKTNLRLRNEMDTFTCYFTVRSDKRGGADFSSSRNAIQLVSNQQKHELTGVFHCYVQLDTNEIACCFFTKESILVPYILIKKETIIAKPRPYVPNMPFEDYKKSLPSIKDVNVDDHVISFGSPPSRVDTSQRFRNFSKSYPMNILYTTKRSEIDTVNYELNHRIQYNFYSNTKNQNYYRFEFMQFYDLSDAIQGEEYYTYPANERYFKPKTKIVYKEKLDLLFKKLAREHPNLLRGR